MLLKDKSDFQRCIYIGQDGCFSARYKNLVLSSVYQPVFSRNNKVVGIEALVRIKDNRGNSVPPNVFFQPQNYSVTDQLNVDRLSRAIHIRNFSLSAFHNHLLFLNFLPISSEQLARDGVDTSLLCNRLKELQVCNKRVVIELLELDAKEEETFCRASNKLRESKFLVAIDDYGCDASTDKRVTAIQPNLVKFDRSLLLEFMRGEEKRLTDGLALAKSCHALTVIEGIETEAQLEAMKAIGFDLYQGYYLALPSAIEPVIQQCVS
ncbi:EAL domain-containing protein [Vibrio sp. ZSDZ34]|uniref:EAL domain-containing protein n=1 Tax=Vibrio gelatinilyticus TaxID=2893468 RepID=A0A9X1WEX4_9VIBR|nr:EAL domain-containing protein [Vibrio gelatinilyticus]MCJ2377085.1 EAL domain-containing protein [Vibrio gelatinilyticus]